MSTTAVGALALDANTTSDQNTALGYAALTDNTTGGNNVAVGAYALANNTTVSNNTAVGRNALNANTTGDNNNAFGSNAADAITTGTNNAAFGSSALGAVTTGGYNSGLGQGAGRLITTGSKNTIVGRYSGNQDGLDIRTLSNRIVVSDGDGNIGMYIDTAGNANFDGNVIAYSTTISDRRLKSDITNISNALDKVGQINGVTFVRNHNGEKAAGIVAQEIMEVLPEAVKSQALPLQTGEQDREYYVVEYDAVTGLLVEAVKELKARVEALENS